MADHALLPSDMSALVAIDLGAESCRVSLLQFVNGEPRVQLVHRFPNQPKETADGLHWDLDAILAGLHEGLRQCAAIAVEGIRSIAVDGWAVDYVRLDENGKPIAAPFCYRDERTIEAEIALNKRISAERMRDLTGVGILRINTAYQFFADPAVLRSRPWLNLPEYVLHSLGARPVSERTNASHTQLLGLDGHWSKEILAELEMNEGSMPDLVNPGTDIGILCGPLSEIPSFVNARLIAPCCHDTASAIAAIPDSGDDWAYISSGTWSLVGTVLRSANNSVQAREENFTNLLGAAGTICFHKNVNGMWLLRQCMNAWQDEVARIDLTTLVSEASAIPGLPYTLDVDDPELLLSGSMPQRINAQLRRRGLREISDAAADAPLLASFIFHSLAQRYAEILRSLSKITGKSFARLYLMGGGSQNQFLNDLTARATGLEVSCIGTECSTMGNFAVQLSTLEPNVAISEWARSLQLPEHGLLGTQLGPNKNGKKW